MGALPWQKNNKYFLLTVSHIKINFISVKMHDSRFAVKHQLKWSVIMSSCRASLCSLNTVHMLRTCMNSSSSTCPFLLRSTSLRISWSAFSSIWTLMLCGDEDKEGSITCNEDKWVKTRGGNKVRKKDDSLPKLAARQQWWWILCSLCQTYGNVSCTWNTQEHLFSLSLLFIKENRLNIKKSFFGVFRINNSPLIVI